MTQKIFIYGEEEIAHLKKRDVRLGEVIDRLGFIEREVHTDLFPSLVHSIVSQQISSKAAATVWGRMCAALGEITPEAITACTEDELQQFGLTFRKASYVYGAAESVVEGRFDLDSLYAQSDEEVCQELMALKGVGRWTAEMLMIFSMQRKNILSYGDLAIIRGMRMVYHHRVITKELFARYKRRYAPYATVASFYLWAVAGGAIEGMKDYAPRSH